MWRWGPIGDHTLCAMVYDLHFCARPAGAETATSHKRPAEMCYRDLLGVKWSADRQNRCRNIEASEIKHEIAGQTPYFADQIPSSTTRCHSADRPRQWKAVGDSAAVDGASVREGPDVAGGWTPKSCATTKLAAWSV
jgi:hypothetical protein